MPVRPAGEVADDQQQRAQRPEQHRRLQPVRHVLYFTCPSSPAPRRLSSAARNAARQGKSSISTCSCTACAPSPRGPSPSRVGTPRAAVKFPSDPPPAATFAEILRRDRAPRRRARLVERGDLRRAFERRAIDPAAQLEPGTSQGRHERPQLRGHSLRIGHRLDAHVDRRVRFVGDHVRPAASRDASDVERDASLRILHRLDRDDLMRELVDGARALPRIQSGVSRDAVHAQLEFADALAARLRAAPGKRRLEHEHRVVGARSGFDRGARGAAADFLVGRPQHRDVRRMGNPERRERAHRQHGHADARLHVERCQDREAGASLDPRGAASARAGPRPRRYRSDRAAARAAHRTRARRTRR